jgi:hypothetical protein
MSIRYILFFITHKTLTLENCALTFYSISNQNVSDNQKIDKLYIYNTHSDELPNDDIVYLYYKYQLNKKCNQYEIFNYNNISRKTLATDVSIISEYCINTYDSNDRILILKSDCLLSVNYFNEIFSIPKTVKEVYFTSPFICAKKRISNNEICEYINRPSYIQSDDVTFFVEDTFHSNDNDFHNRKSVSIYDSNIHFFSCCVINDFSVHLISVCLLHKLLLQEQS